MPRGRRGAVRIAGFLLLALSLSIVAPIAAAGSTGTSAAVSAAVSQPNGVTTAITFTPEYSLFIPTVSETVNASLKIAPLQLSSDLQVRFLSSFKPQEISVHATTANGTVVPLGVTQIPGTFGSFSAYYITIPASAVSLSATILGRADGESFLWRHVTHIPVLLVDGLNVKVTYTSEVIIPSGSIVSAAYAFDSSSQHVPPGVRQGGETAYILDSSVTTVVVQSASFVLVTLALTGVALSSVILISLGIISRNRRLPLVAGLMQSISRTAAGGTRFARRVYVGAAAFLQLRRPAGGRQGLFGGQRRWHTALLILFILCGTLMVSAGALAGPSPHIKVYLIASPSSVLRIQSNLQSILGGNVQVITPSQDYTDFQVMSSVGTFNMIIISDYPSLAVPEVAQFVLPNLGNVPLIIIDKSADPTFVSDVSTLYENTPTLMVQDAGNLNENEAATLAADSHGVRQPNLLGLQLGERGFQGLVAMEGLLSLVLVFLGFAAVGALASQPNKEDDGDSLSRISSIVALGVFVFFFSEVVYVATSAVLTLPLSLHAVISGSQTITAIGVLGQLIHIPFGGGSTPRLAAGVIGVLFGALGTGRAGPFNRKSFVLMGSIAAILLLNPFTIGQYVFQGLLLFIGNVSFGGAYASTVTVKGLLYGIGAGLGGVASPFYLLSAGKIIYFAGLVPMAFLKKMGRTTASLTLLICSLFVGDGGVRVGEMTPEKTAIAVMPGLIAGFGLVMALLLISAVEKYLVRNYAATRPS